MRGTITVSGDFTGDTPDAACTPDEGFADIHEGAQVTVFDGAQTIVGTTTLNPGTLAEVIEVKVRGNMKLDPGPKPPETPFDSGDPEWAAYMSHLRAEQKLIAEYLASPPTETAYTGSCSLSFEVLVQTADADFYSVEVAHRGKVNYSVQDLEANGWTMSVSL